MKVKLIWNLYVYKNHLSKICERKVTQISRKLNITRKTKKNVNRKRLLEPIEVNELIYKKIIDGEPFWVGRFGQSELNMIYASYENRINNKKKKIEPALVQMCNNAGFFPNDIDLIEKYVDRMLEDYKLLDLQGYWDLFMADYFMNKFNPNCEITRLSLLEPWWLAQYADYEGEIWTRALKGKKVLIIHPFAESIKYQYDNNRTRIFAKSFTEEDILPEFELLTIKAVQTIANNKDSRFNNWFEALEWMENKVQNIDFDVAIIGCGAYGFPLAASVKRMGKIAIHLGGATQLMFGIKGKRWENFEIFNDKILNEFWRSPMEEEIPNNISKVEKGCYW